MQVIQLGAVRFISTLFTATDCVQSFSCETIYFAPDNQEVWGVGFNFFKFIVLLVYKLDLSDGFSCWI